MIELKEVQVRIQNQIVLDNINLTFELGVNYWITGDNGSGKTLLLKLLSGQLQPYTGTIHYHFINEDLDWDSKFELRKQFIHFVPTQALHSLLKGQEFYYQQRYYSIEEDVEQTVKKFFGFHLSRLSDFNFPQSFQIDHLLNLEINRLSNGQLKKIIILKRLLESIPKILLLDYPFEGLDATSRIELSDFLEYLSNHHKVQLIIVDHNHSYLPKSLTKKLVISSGRIIVSEFNKADAAVGIKQVSIDSSVDTISSSVVEMKNASIKYGSQVILENLNWRVNRGERWALTGRNGSGKTTLFSLIYADHPLAYSNEIYLFGKRRGTGESIWDIKRRISYLGPEQIHFLDHHTESLTVSEYLNRINLESLKVLIDYFNLNTLLPIKLRYLSNGQLQLVMLIALFLEKKELILLDEPFQFLDSHQKKRVNDYLQTILDTQTTLILITHFEEDVDRWTNKRLRL